MSTDPRKGRRKTRTRSRPASSAATAIAARIYNEGVEWQQRCEFTLAESSYRKALSIQPDFAEAHNNLGNLLKDQGKWKAAEKSFRRALELLPDNAMLLTNIGDALRRQDKPEAALEAFETSLRLDPFNALAHHYLGELLSDLDRPGAAIEHFARAHELMPHAPVFANRLGATLCRQERYEEAVAILHATVKAHPRYFDAYPNLAEAAFKIGAVDDAVKVLEEAMKLAPENDAVMAQLAEIHYARQDYLAARRAISRAIGIKQRNADYINLLGKILCRMNLTDEAADMARKAIALRPDAANYHHSLGVALIKAGKHREARHSLRRAIRLQPDNTYSHLMLAKATQHRSHDEDMRAMETLLADDDLSDQQVICLHFGLGKAFDDLGDFAQAFRHFARGHGLMQAQSTTEYDAGRLFRTLAATFSHECLQQHQDSGHRAVTPIFITGLPRSGKTVLENILARHPLVMAGGEFDEFQRVTGEIVAARTGTGFPDGIPELETPAFAEIGRAYVECLQQRLAARPTMQTNTSPSIAGYIGMIRLCLPDARVILCRREARDLCTEIYKKKLTVEHHYSHDPEELGNFYLLHRDLMDHWCRLLPEFIHVMHFEELLRDPENQVNALLDFCGLSREAGCLDTASLPKAENSIGVWQHYREPLKSLYETLDVR